MKRKYLGKFLGGMIVLTIILISSALVWAKPVGISIGPVKIFLTIEKGETEDSSVTAINPNDFPIEVITEVEDFVPATVPGDITFIPKYEGVTSLVDWLKIEKAIFPLGPNERKEVPFKIEVPEDAGAGGHYAAIFFKAVPKEVEGTALQISGRVGVLVMVAVPGEVIQTGEIAEFKGPRIVSRGPIEFVILFRNTGTTHYQPEGTIEITNLLGKKTSLEVPKQVVFPQGSKNLKAVWDVKYLFGRYTAKLNLADGEGNIHTAILNFWVFPWQEVLGLFVIASILVFIGRIIRKKFKIVIAKR